MSEAMDGNCATTAEAMRPPDPENEGACITVGALTIERKKKRHPGASFDVASEFNLYINGRTLLDIGSVSEVSLKFSGGKGGNEIVKTIITVEGPSREFPLATRAREIAEKAKDLPRMSVEKLVSNIPQIELTPEQVERIDRQFCTEYALVDGEYVKVRDRQEVDDGEPHTIG